MLGNYKDIEMWGLSLCDGLISGIRRNLDEGEREEMATYLGSDLSNYCTCS